MAIYNMYWILHDRFERNAFDYYAQDAKFEFHVVLINEKTFKI